MDGWMDGWREVKREKLHFYCTTFFSHLRYKK
jgi:hypothetical protein